MKNPIDLEDLKVSKEWRKTEDFEAVFAFIKASRPIRLKRASVDTLEECPFSGCKEQLSEIVLESPDGKWKFQDSLEHLIMMHGVVPCDEFVSDAKSWVNSSKLSLRDIVAIDIITDRILIESETVEEILSSLPPGKGMDAKRSIERIIKELGNLRDAMETITNGVKQEEEESEPEAKQEKEEPEPEPEEESEATSLDDVERVGKKKKVKIKK